MLIDVNKLLELEKKASPGPLHGVSGDVWSALAVALTYMDQHQPAAAG